LQKKRGDASITVDCETILRLLQFRMSVERKLCVVESEEFERPHEKRRDQAALERIRRKESFILLNSQL